jgi:hypothetical protein
MKFFVKVRIDISKMAEFGRKLQSGEIKTHPELTYCLKDDPSVGINIWQAADNEDFERVFLPHREFYQEVIEISPVISPEESMKILSANR